MIRFERLDTRHDVSAFQCRNTYLDDYLKKTALAESKRGIANTFLAIESADDGNEAIVGYFTLVCTAQYIPAVRADIAEDYVYPAEIRCLARDFSRFGQGIGETLLVEALEYVAHAANYVGLPGVFLIATSEGISLYERFGFLRLYPDKRELYMPIADIHAIVTVSSETIVMPAPDDEELV